MNKFLSSSHHRVVALSLLIILTGLFLSTTTRCGAENLSEKGEFDFTIGLAAPLPGEAKVEDVKIQNTVNISYIYVNEEDLDIQKSIPLGQVVWKSDNTVQSASVIDNLGGSFAPINLNGSIMNPPLEGTLPPNFTYVLSLIVVLMPGASYLESYQAWQFSSFINCSVPAQATVTLPNNFSAPFYTAGANYSKDQNKVLTWQILPHQALNVSVVFLPFLYNPETTSLSFIWDIPSIFPVFTNVKATMTQTFQSLSVYNGLNVPQIFQIPVLFPAIGKDIRVVSVYDTEGPYSKLNDLLIEPNNADYGTYYLDYNSSEVIVYPRAEQHANHFDYDVNVVFNFGNEAPANVTFGPLMPYDISALFNITNVKLSGDWKLNMTQGTTIEFWLPQGTQPYPRSDYTIDTTEDGRYAVKFVNTSSEMTSGIWKVDFYIIRLYNLFWTEICSIIIFAAVIITMTVLRKHSFGSFNMLGWKLMSYGLPSFSALGLIAAEYNIMGDWFWDIISQKPVLTILLAIQVVLNFSIVILAHEWKFGQRTTVEASQTYVA